MPPGQPQGVVAGRDDKPCCCEAGRPPDSPLATVGRHALSVGDRLFHLGGGADHASVQEPSINYERPKLA